MTRFFKAEPARAVALVIAVLSVATSFGLGITDGQQAAIVALVGAVVAMVGGETVRSQVTPTSKLEDAPASNLVALVDAHSKPAPAKKAAAKRPAKKAAPKPPSGLS
jgi:hypothetical protein